MSVGLILLAAGGSRRLGTPKQLLRDGEGRSLIRRAAEAALASACRPVVVVLGAAAEDVGRELAGLPVRTAFNPVWESGLASSLQAGLDALTSDAELEAVVVMLCDQPGVSAPLPDSLVAAHRATGHNVIACEYGGILGVPSLFARTTFGALSALSGDEGARHVIRRHAGSVTSVPFPKGTFDVDTPQDARTLLRT